MLTTTLLIAASFALGQDTESAAYEHLKELECFIGSWQGKTQVPESSAGSESLKKWAGKPLLLRMNVRWAPGKSAQFVEEVNEIPGEAKITASRLRGWDQSAQKIKDHSFTTHKGVWTGTWEKRGDTWVTDYTGFNLDGEKCTGTQEITVVNKDTLAITDKSQTVGGKPFPDMQYEYKRAGTLQQASNYERLKGLEFLIGEWQATGNDGGTTHWTFNWTPSKNELQNVITSKGPSGAFLLSHAGVLGWDSAEGRITNWCVTNKGKQVKYLWAKRDDGKWETWPPGSQSPAVVTSVDDDTWKMEVGSSTQVFKRIKK